MDSRSDLIRIGSVLNDVNGQTDLLKQTSGINLAQWQRETAYNSPKEQMKRLKEAGLNPDLIYGNGGMSNTAESAQLTQGTPQSRGVLHGISQAINAAANLGLLESEKAKNFADAKRSTAQAGEHSINTEYKSLTMMPAYQKLCADLNLTKAEEKKTLAQVDEIVSHSLEMLKQIDFYEANIGLINQKTATERFNTRSAAYNSDILRKSSQWFDEEMFTKLEKWRSECNVNKAYFANVWENTRFLKATFDARWNHIFFQNKYYQTLNDYHLALKDLTRQQVQLYPFTLLNGLGIKLTQVEIENGQVKTDDKGMPLIKDKAVRLDRTLQVTGDIMSIIGTGAAAYRDISFGTAAFKAGIPGHVYNNSTNTITAPPYEPTLNYQDVRNQADKYTKKHKRVNPKGKHWSSYVSDGTAGVW